MKKVLSLVLALAMIATLFTGTIAMPASAETASAPVQSINDSIVIADYTTTAEGYRAVTNSDSLGYNVDMTKLDLNTKYQIRLTAHVVANEEGTAVTGWVYSNVLVDGVYGRRGWDNGEIRIVANPTEFSTESKQYLSIDTLSGYGQQVVLQVCPRDFNAGVLHIEKIELVPQADTTANGGYVLSTGYDEERGLPIYTAYANPGYTVGVIKAMSQFRSTTAGRDYQYMECGVEIINEVSASEVQFVVDITATGDEGDYGHRVIYGRGFISAFFNEKAGPVQHISRSIVVKDFTKTAEGYYQATNSESLRYDVNMSKLDLNTKYQIRLTATAVANEEGTAVTGWVYSNVIVDGIYGRRGWDNGEIRVTQNGAEFATESAQYLSIDTLSGYGQNIVLEICPRNFNTGVLRIEKIELVPATDTSANGGYVLATGYDEERGTTVYTAYAEEGFNVGAITAMSQFRSTTAGRDYQYMQCGIEIINKVSSGEVQFVVDITDTGDEGDYGHRVIYGRGFITASFIAKPDPIQSANDSLVLADYTKTEAAGYKTVSDSDNLNYNLDYSRLDANTKYNIRVTLNTVRDAEDTPVVAWIYANLKVDGAYASRSWDKGHMDVTPVREAAAELAVESTQYVSLDTISIFGNSGQIELCPRRIANGTLNIEKVELIPHGDTSSNGGFVAVTGYDNERGLTIYTAYANEGYKVNNIAAKVQVRSTTAGQDYQFQYCTIEVLNKYSEAEIEFVVDKTKTSDANSYGQRIIFGAGFIEAAFVEADVVPMLSPDESYMLYDFDTNDQLADFSGAYIETDPEFAYGGEGGSLAFDGAVTKEYNIVLDAGDIAHFDANNRYFVEMEFSAEATSIAIIYINTYYDFGHTSGSIARTQYENHMDIVGLGPDKLAVAGDDSYSTYRSTSSIPIVGKTVRLQLCIRNTGMGVIQLDNIRLVPEYDRTDAHGYIQSSYNAETNTVDFIATAEEGYLVKELTLTKAACNIGEELQKKLGIGAYDEYTWTYAPTKQLSDTQTLFSLSAADMTPEAGFIVCDNGDKEFIRVAFIDAATLDGDINGDLAVNVLDLVRLKNYIAGNDVTIDEAKADLDGDGEIAIGDIVELRKVLLGI